MPAWHCQPPGHKPEPLDIPLPTQFSHPSCLLNPLISALPHADSNFSDPLPASRLTFPACLPPTTTKSCQLFLPSFRPPQLPERSRGLVSRGNLSLPHHKDVCGDGPVRKQQCLPDKDADLPRRNQNNRQEAFPPPAASGCSLHPGCGQGTPKPPSPPWSLHRLAVRLTRNLWLIKPCPQP